MRWRSSHCFRSVSPGSRSFRNTARAAGLRRRRPASFRRQVRRCRSFLCIDDLAGDAVLNACEKALFGLAESAAAARGLRGLPDHAADFPRRCRHREQGCRLRPAGAAPRGRARSLRTDGLRADDARPLHAVDMPAVPLVDQQEPNCGQYGRARLREPGRTLCASLERAATSCLGAARRAPPSAPTGKPTSAEFPTSASTPPVSIMNSESPLGHPRRSRRPPPRPHRVRPRPWRRHSRRRPRQKPTAAAETGAGSARRRPLRHPQLIATSDLFKARAGRYIGRMMPLHLIKLAVGCESVKELKGWVAERMATAKKRACRFATSTSRG